VVKVQTDVDGGGDATWKDDGYLYCFLLASTSLSSHWGEADLGEATNLCIHRTVQPARGQEQGNVALTNPWLTNTRSFHGHRNVASNKLRGASDALSRGRVGFWPTRGDSAFRVACDTEMRMSEGSKIL
jgi:hypothetical protein